jgi:hypothetical protein
MGAFIRKRSARGGSKRLFRLRRIGCGPDGNTRKNTHVEPREAIIESIRFQIDATDLSRILYRRCLGITFTDAASEGEREGERSTEFHEQSGRSGTRAARDIEPPMPKRLSPRQLSLRSHGGLAYTAEAGYGGVNATGKPRPVIASFGDRRFSERRNVPLRTYPGTFSSFLKARHYLFIAWRTLLSVFPAMPARPVVTAVAYGRL